MKTALLIVDLQKDFCPGGALAVEDGDKVVEPCNRLIRFFEEHGWLIYFTRDWHPTNHCSFKANGGPWPPHCVAYTPGAEFPSELYVPPGTTVISKADDPDKEAYSGFDGSVLGDLLKAQAVEAVVVAGLTTDYCVKTTALDALRLGFAVTVAIDAIKAVNVESDDGQNAIKLMQRRGAEFQESQEIILKLSSQ